MRDREENLIPSVTSKHPVSILEIVEETFLQFSSEFGEIDDAPMVSTFQTCSVKWSGH